MNYEPLESAISTLASMPPSSLFAIVGGLLVTAFCLYFYKQRRDCNRLTALEDTVKLRAMSRLVSAQQEEMSLLRERLGTLEAYVDRLNNRQQRLAENTHQRKQRVDDAIAIAIRGQDDSDLASRAGVSPSEAKLIASLYSQNAPA
ncbi:hypothetical protein [Litorivivens sp.]|uniref:hypothetical protein n=1 Tax=Litorivivens sp. TaxID=2020868 RepID=UPI003562F618